MFWNKSFGKKMTKTMLLEPNRHKELEFDGLKFYYRCEDVDYEAHGRQGACQFQQYGFEHDHNITDSWMIFKNKAGKSALVIYVSVPTFDSGDREWDSYRKLFLIPEVGGMTGFMVCGGYNIARIIAYKDIRYADEKTESLLGEAVKNL